MRLPVWLPLLAMLGNCSPPEEAPSSEAPESVRAHCGACHLPPDPALLDRTTWKESILPQMAPYLGMPSRVNPLARLSSEEAQRILKANLYPDQPILSPESWSEIQSHYLRHAPEKLPPQAAKPAPLPAENLFEAVLLREPPANQPLTTFITWDSTSRQILLGDAANRLRGFDLQGQQLFSLQTSSPVVDLLQVGRRRLLLQIGILHPNDKSTGSLRWSDRPEPLLSRLDRPVQMLPHDFNHDGKQDLLICQFGHHLGRLSWWEAWDAPQPEEHLLLQAPGAVSARLHDMDGDGRQDLVVLMAQGDEGVDIYFDRADSWERRRVLRFPPVFGVSSLEVADFNDDGRPDLLIANGDNADFSYGLKPYHGLRIFTGAPDGTFHESWFYPLYGATRALTGDFNLDGQPDIAAIAFFADFESPHPESFVLLLQQSAQPLRFQPHTLPQSRLSRWLVLHSADVDADGDPDLLLGAFTFSPTPVPDSLRRFWREQRLAALLLRNRTR